jgi:hypothetical protein
MVVGVTRSMLKAKGLLGWFWGEAVTTAVYLLNRVPCKANGGRTPFELWHRKTPTVQHLKVFGCIVYVKNTVPYLKKLDDRGRKMIFVGYERGSKVYRAYDPVTRRVIVTRDVVFDESGSWDWSGKSEGNVDKTGQDYSSFSVEYRGVQVPEIEAVEPEDDGQGSGPDSVAEQSEEENPGLFSPVAEIGGQNSPMSGVQQMNPLFEPSEAENLDADCEGAPLRFREMSDLIGPAVQPGRVERELANSDGDRVFTVSAEESSWSSHRDSHDQVRNTRYCACIKLCTVFIRHLVPGIRNCMRSCVLLAL